MSCGLCGHLKRKLGAPPFTLEPPSVNDPGREHLCASAPRTPLTLHFAMSVLLMTCRALSRYTANMDFHPFGAWLANNAARHGRSVEDLVAQIHNYRASNGEEMHGYLWQSLRLLAYDTGSLDGTRLEEADEARATDHAMRVCAPAWYLAPQTRDDCAHAAGHGFFYHFFDIGKAISACWTDKMVDHTPCGSLPCRETDKDKSGEIEEGEKCNEESKVFGILVGTINCGTRFDADQDTDTRSSGLNPQDMLKWRWLCATGVYHAAGNTLSVEALQKTNDIGSTAEELLCRRSNLWGDDTPYFDRCAAGLGMKETEGRLQMVREGKCPSRAPGGQPVAWERAQLAQCKRQPIEPTRRLVS